MKKLDLAPYYIIACCVLHDVALLTNNELVYPVFVPSINAVNVGSVFPTNAERRIGRQRRQDKINFLNQDN